MGIEGVYREFSGSLQGVSVIPVLVPAQIWDNIGHIGYIGGITVQYLLQVWLFAQITVQKGKWGTSRRKPLTH